MMPQPALAEAIGGTFTLQIENDRIANTNRHYTHGTRLAWVSDKAFDGPQWAKDALEWLYPLADLRAGRVGPVLGQNIFTPEDTHATALVRDDRPYVGWLYAGISVHAETTRQRNGQTIDAIDSVEFDLGIVGPESFAEGVQGSYQDPIGAAVVWRGMRLAFTDVFRIKEFDGQHRADRYGARSLSTRL